MDYRNNSSYPYKPAFAQQQPQDYPSQPAYQQPQPVAYPQQPTYSQQQPTAYSQQPAGAYAEPGYAAPVAVAAPGYGVPAPAPVVPADAAPIVADDPNAVMALYPTGNEEPAEPAAAVDGGAEGEAEVEPATLPELANPVVETIESVMVDIVEARELPDKSDTFSSIDPFVVILAGTHTRVRDAVPVEHGPRRRLQPPSHGPAHPRGRRARCRARRRDCAGSLGGQLGLGSHVDWSRARSGRAARRCCDRPVV
ncbi:hypothetical protein AMAG_00006 [Allomyces macrogynus ATCC 38327]|uniref:Uncharacterized protein n=1 Tax=Allomyces macrogynus (strain ATCC 38327) TaxID=578462 RepID=A0A0L0RVB6_ALLM3|nr:hypothetical protein AMAG_00006 [Allomyces macrogynus ATCC 38327]|eukprot:KNE54010.1 hypothetical protein AMAG_00006 [Allomyces macrogynus ATCC 38327]